MENNTLKTIMAVLYGTIIALVCILTHTTVALQNPLSNEFIDQINSKQSLWKAGRNFPQHTSAKYINNLMGTLKDDVSAKLPRLKHDVNDVDLPENFDPRDKWSNCPSLNEIRDQGSCASCWAFGAVEAMTDRFCIHSNGTQQFHFSAEDLISCCEICGLGCIRGVHTAAWQYWQRVGLVSGGSYNSNEGCRPYKIPPVGNVTGDIPLFAQIVDISECVTSCDSSYNVDYYKDKHYGKRVYSIDRNEEQIQSELFKNGPVEGVMAVYADFLNYKYGIYKHTEGNLLGHHAVKILGWGQNDGHKYWLVANSWSQAWGDKGFFTILRGVDHCGIESSIVAGEPLII